MKYAIRTVLAVAAITAATYSFPGKTEKPEEPETISQEAQIEQTYEAMPDEVKVMGDAEIKPCNTFYRNDDLSIGLRADWFGTGGFGTDEPD